VRGFKSWKRFSKRRRKADSFAKRHTERVRRATFRRWATRLQYVVRCHAAMGLWLAYAGRQRAQKRGEEHFAAREREVQRGLLRVWRGYTLARQAGKLAQTHVTRVLRARAADGLLRWRAAIRCRAACTQAKRHWQARTRKACKAAVKNWRQRIRSRAACRVGMTGADKLLVRRTARAFGRWKHRTARNLLAALAQKAQSRRACRKALHKLR
jgi:hypothetical protein